jgi:hypothetical protein
LEAERNDARALRPGRVFRRLKPAVFGRLFRRLKPAA